MSVILEATRQGTQPVAFINVVSSHLFREEKEIRDKSAPSWIRKQFTQRLSTDRSRKVQNAD